MVAGYYVAQVIRVSLERLSVTYFVKSLGKSDQTDLALLFRDEKQWDDEYLIQYIKRLDAV